MKEKTTTISLEQLRGDAIKNINTIIDGLINQTTRLEALKKQTSEEQETRQRQQKQLEEEQDFTFTMTQRKKQAEFDEQLRKDKNVFEEMRKKSLEELQIKKDIFETKEKEYNELKARAETIPQQIQKALDENTKRITSDLKKDFETEKKLLTQKYEADLKLKEQFINSLQQLVKQLEKEVVSLKEEKKNMLEQMKDLAVAVIKGKEKELQSPVSPA